MANVMVVDDSAFTRRTHRRILESAGHAVVEAATGMEAIEGFFLHRPDVVLLDLSMEDMGGLDVLRRLRELETGARVLVVSADVQRSTGRMVEESGALGFLGKPVSPEELLTKLNALLAAVAP